MNAKDVKAWKKDTMLVTTAQKEKHYNARRVLRSFEFCAVGADFLRDCAP